MHRQRCAIVRRSTEGNSDRHPADHEALKERDHAVTVSLAGQPIPSGLLNITGIVIHSDAGYCLAPRGPGDIVPVPEPATLALLVLGGMGFAGRTVRRRRRRDETATGLISGVKTNGGVL